VNRYIAFKKGSEICKTLPRPYIKNLDSLPLVDWESLPISTYYAKWTQKKIM
tara:strand:- start:794 stop:949 length:156 start_codon:yes stop_codon:yes gene_type:complete